MNLNLFAISTLLTGILSLVLIIFIFVSRKRSKLTNIWILVSACVCLWSLGLFVVSSVENELIAEIAQIVLDFSAIFIPVFFLYFVIHLVGWGDKYRKLFRILFVFFTFFGLFSLTPWFKIGVENKPPFQYWVKVGDFYLLFPIFFIIMAAISIIILLKSYKKTSGLKRQQIKYVLICALIGFVGGATNFLPQYLPLYPYGNFLVVSYVFIIAYSIIRHRLLDLRLVVSRSIIYFFLVLFVAAMFTGVTFLTGHLFEEVLGVNTFLVTLGVSIFIVAFLDPIKRWLSKATDRVFFKAKIEYPELTRKLSQILATEIEIDDLIEKFSKKLAQGLKIEKSVLVLEDKGIFHVRKIGHPHTKPLEMDQNNPLIKYLSRHDEIIITEELQRKTEDEAKVKKKKELKKSLNELKKIKAAAVVPIKTQEKLNAVLVLGAKLSGDVFNREEISLIEVLSPQVASAIEKSKLYEEVKSFSETLQQKVEEATQELSERNRFLISLQKVTNMITRSLDLKKVTQNIVNSISEELGYIGGLLLFLDQKKKVIYPAAITEAKLTNQALKLLPKKMQAYSTPINKDKTLDGMAIKEAQIKFGSGFQEFISPPVPKAACLGMNKLLGVKTIVAVPIFSEDDVIGVIDFVTKKKREDISKKELEAMRSLADQTGIVSRNLRLFEQIQKTNKELEEANERLKQLDEAKTEFVSIASHQLRTPMTSIKGYLSMLTAGDFGKLKPEHNKLLKQLLDESERMIRLINQFLNVSKIEAGKFELSKNKIKLEEMVAKLVDELKKPAEEKGLKLIYKKPKKKMPQVMADSDKISEIILNLIDNAIKYTEKGKIVVNLEKEKDNIKFSVKDTGVGIAPKEAKNLFGKFSRGPGIAKIQPDGSGLGLFISKNVVEGHHGKIWVESEGKGKGSQFCFLLPIK
ncbi:MAG: ATP-binding protein [Patescibacteria group bacterium]|nr:ATP-binding protein [Patescibacteria group bacterium]